MMHQMVTVNAIDVVCASEFNKNIGPNWYHYLSNKAALMVLSSTTIL